MTAVVIPRPGDDQGGPCPWGAGRRVQSAHAEGEVGGRSREGVELWPAEEVQVERCHRSRKRSMNEAIIHDYSNEMLSRGLNRYLITRIIVSAMLFGAASYSWTFSQYLCFISLSGLSTPSMAVFTFWHSISWLHLCHDSSFPPRPLGILSVHPCTALSLHPLP